MNLISVGRARSDSIIAIPWWLFVLFLTLHLSAAVRLHKIWSCSSENIALNCKTDELIAVHKATLTTEDATNCGGNSFLPYQNNCQEDLRSSFNIRCGGHNACIFNFTSDHWDKECKLDRHGVIIADYACVAVASVQKYCSAPVQEEEGYLANPGYPSFFPKLDNCTWGITAGYGQTVLLTIVDLDLPKSHRQFGRDVCDDVLHVTDGTESKLLSVCGGIPPKTVESTGEKVAVYFQSRAFTPFRGFLLYYRVHGCPTLPSPKLGYMVYRNGSTALYMCCEGHLFNDTLDNYRPLHCVDDFHWNATIPSTCISIDDIQEGGNSSEFMLGFGLNNNMSVGAENSHVYKVETHLLADIVIPSILMAGLIIGNGVVFIIIFRIRRNQKLLSEGKSERKTTSLHNTPLVFDT